MEEKNPQRKTIVPGRSCEGCTKCCEGYLVAHVMGQVIDSGKPCVFLQKGKGCGIYEYRTADVCETFRCEWLTNPDVPEDMKPSKSGIILKWTYANEKYNLTVAPAGKPVTDELVAWLEQMVEEDKFKRVWYYRNGETHTISKDVEWKELEKTKPYFKPKS